MPLLVSLLSALAKRKKPGNVIPAAAPLPSLVAGSRPLPRDKHLKAVYGSDSNDEDALRDFLALSRSDQLAAIDAELLRLPDHEKIVVLETLRKELGRKWMALPGPQTQALRSEADIILYGGQAGGGKSDLLCGLALTEHKRSLLMRREYDDLSYLTERAIDVNGTRTGFSQSPHPTMRTTDGRLLQFRAAQRIESVERRQGQPFDLLAIDEATQFLEAQIRFLFGWLRTTDETQRLRIVLATNPPLSDEGQWIVAMFAPWLDPQHHNPAKPGELRWYVADEEGNDKEVDGLGPHKVGVRQVKAKSRTFIPSRLSDNAYLARDDRYAAQLDSLWEPLRSIVRDGNFMAARKDDAFQVIPSDWVRQAQARWTETPPLTPQGQHHAMTCIAVDSAGGGSDAAVIAHRYATWYGPLTSEKGPQTADGRFIGARVLMERRNNCQIVVDVGGGYGADIVTTLNDNDAPVIAYKGANASTYKVRGSNLACANTRAESWWKFREALDPVNGDKLALPPDQQLGADLSTPRLDARALQVRGIIQVESKEEIRKRLGRSPDKGDAVVMAYGHGELLQLQQRASPRLPPRANVGHAKAKGYARR